MEDTQLNEAYQTIKRFSRHLSIKDPLLQQYLINTIALNRIPDEATEDEILEILYSEVHNYYNKKFKKEHKEALDAHKANMKELKITIPSTIIRAKKQISYRQLNGDIDKPAYDIAKAMYSILTGVKFTFENKRRQKDYSTTEAYFRSKHGTVHMALEYLFENPEVYAKVLRIIKDY